ncbi:PPK2 family polyphosphate kinase [Mycetocola reblochoni]|uniref:UDP-galactose-lipid carrier transferase n=2 Tax=Mycetocola reblochoni TaxID=331618 RepID=A0A1R4IXC0_9MICO|nr:PPK2 family polyphosphate kinase [Mycetocola reblochoni]RLP70924.1 polyphosphate kinase 2 family protein [Mycetocola reblochoni]SJN24492.1 UDP-galactose-lipid carrier transferase [Mycetocola reblochoni REB411]
MSEKTDPAAAIASAVTVGADARLPLIDPRSTPGFDGGKAEGEELLARDAARLDGLQERLFASGFAGTTDAAVLLVIQGMDTAGKGGIVRHVVGAVDPQGVRIRAFKAPTPEEAAHDFLWRIERELPEPGMIGVFDRSHYEDVLAARVRGLAAPDEIERRYDAIVEAERAWAERGIRIVKVMLHISPEEQHARLSSRLDRPDKRWKFSPADIDDRLLWPSYQDAYQRVLARTAAEPWAVVPADRKWYARLAVQSLLLRALEGIAPVWPLPAYDVDEQRHRLAGAVEVGTAEGERA